MENISATALALALSLGEVQVRKDLAMVSDGGRPKIGYNRLNLIDDIAERRQLDVTAARNAYFEILYVGFASVFDMHRVFPKIKVAIDINYQFGLEAILTDMLLGLRAMNVEVSEFIDDDTDILISDINHAQIPEENTFIWPTMPTSLDFEQLRRRLSEMKVEKFEEERGIKLRFPTN